MRCRPVVLFVLLFALLSSLAFAQNPLVMNQFTADPTARVFGDTVYLYPSHDILATEGHGRPGWFCMEDYHVFSSANLRDWTDRGMIASQLTIPWANPTAYSLWAPDCIERNGKYYFYFPAPGKEGGMRGFSVGVAVADKPAGPYTPQPAPISGVHGIDPNVFIDKDGQAYLYWAGRGFQAAKLKENMLELASEPVVLEGFPEKGLKEGPFLFERNGQYYMTYPHVADKTTERLEYAVSDNPLGPFKVTGVMMDEKPGCWTNHQSVIQFKGQWYLFYHHNDLSPNFDKNRSARIDSLFFNDDGTIRKAIPSLRGVGATPATQHIQIDRYTAIDSQAATVVFSDTSKKVEGWKTLLSAPGAWIQYNSVEFGKGIGGAVTVRSVSEKGGTVQVRLDGMDGPVVAECTIPKGSEWKEIRATMKSKPAGLHHVFVILKDQGPVEIDWVAFE